MKKFYLITIACLVSGVSLAGAPTRTVMPATSNYFNGFYLGAGAGLTHATAHNSFNDSEFEGTIDYVGYSYRNNIGTFSGLANIFAGYGRTLGQHFYLGGELFGRYTPTQLTSTFKTRLEKATDIQLNRKLTLDYAYGALLRAGYLSSPRILLYVLLGYMQAHLDIQDSFHSFDDEIRTVKRHENPHGWMAGFGIETYLTPKLSARTQYTYTRFGQFKYRNTYNFSSQYHVVESHQDRLEQGAISIDLIYHIG